MYEPDYNNTGPVEPILQDDSGWAAFLIMFGAVIITVATLLLIMFFISKKKQFAEQTALGIKTETEDDLDYALKDDDEDLERGYSIETGEWK